MYARTRAYQHASSPQIPGLYSIDSIKMVDDHDIKYETAGKVKGIDRTALVPIRYTQVTLFTMSMLLSGLEIVQLCLY